MTDKISNQFFNAFEVIEKFLVNLMHICMGAKTQIWNDEKRMANHNLNLINAISQSPYTDRKTDFVRTCREGLLTKAFLFILI